MDIQFVADLPEMEFDFWFQLEDQIKQIEESKTGKDKEKESLEDQVKKLMEGSVVNDLIFKHFVKFCVYLCG